MSAVIDGKNNFQYNSIGKYLTDNGIISKTDISMLKIIMKALFLLQV